MVIADGQTVAAYLGKSGDAATAALAEAQIPIATAMVKAYVRDVGFDELGDPNDEIAAVIVAMVARTVDNPTLEKSASVDDASIDKQVVLGWTIPELAVLNRYRRRAH